MSEEEFLDLFAKRYEDINLKYDVNPNVRKDFIRNFLTEHRKNYRETYWYKRDLKVIEMEKEQVRNKLLAFVEFLIPYLDDDFVRTKINEYINERLYKQ